VIRLHHMSDEHAMQTLRLNLAVIPPMDTSNQLVMYAKELLPTDAPYVLDGRSYFPHLSLYMTDVLRDNQEEFLKIARKICVSVEAPLQCLADSIAVLLVIMWKFHIPRLIRLSGHTC
jgi:hypothetical protein